MKKLIALITLLSIQLVSAQEVTKTLGDFSTVKVFDRISVKLVAAPENKIVITGSRAGDIELVTKNNELKIRMKFSKLLKGEDITAVLYYKRIEKLDASEGSYVSSEDIFKVTSFELSAKEGAKIKLNLDVQKLKSRLNSGGEAELTGKAANHDGTITSGGILKAKALITSQTDININAGGEADINAAQLADAKVRAGGSINIYGKPAQVNKKTAVGGSIEIRE